MNRTLKTTLAVIAAAVLAALAWRALQGAVPVAAVPPAPAPAVAIVDVPLAASAPAVAMSAPRPMKSAAVHVDDPACIVKLPPPTQADADADSTRPEPAVDAQAQAQASRARLLARLSASADPYAVAVATWLDIGEQDDMDHRSERMRKLAAMAASSQDPRLYSLALRTCWRKTDHGCETLSARRWTEIDPGNAMPWLMLLDEAVQRQDESGLHEALFHITHAERLAERGAAPLQPIVDAASDDPSSLAAARAMAIDAIGIAAAQVGPTAYRACAQATSADANLWQQCTAMADLLEHRSDSFTARLSGASIDKRMTGNAKPGRQIAAQMEHFMKLDLASTSSCDDLRAKLAVMRRLAVDGEAAVARDLAR